MKDAPAFDFYPERWLVGVAALSDLEQIAYLRLLCHQWLAGDDGLSNDVVALKRLAGKGCTPAVLAKFPVGSDGGRRNERLETVRQEQRERIATRRLGGALTNAKRHGIESLSDEDRALVIASPKWKGDVAQASLATRSIIASDVAPPIASASPPPTTHPSTKKERATGAGAGAWPTVEEVKAYAPTVSASAECAEHFWNGSEAAGWVNKHGQPIADWRPLFRNFATAWKANDQRTKTNATHRQTPPRNDSANQPGRYA